MTWMERWLDRGNGLREEKVLAAAAKSPFILLKSGSKPRYSGLDPLHRRDPDADRSGGLYNSSTTRQQLAEKPDQVLQRAIEASDRPGGVTNGRGRKSIHFGRRAGSIADARPLSEA